jgi:tryptophanyl-tRNA synthetase
MTRGRAFSGIQPTGAKHLGNLLGAVNNWVPLQDSGEAFYCVVDLHAMTVPYEPRRLHEKVLQTTALLLAAGIDPERSVVFAQSDVAEHTELTWILTCLARDGELRRMIQYKEKSKGEGEATGVGLLVYPVLQAADVLLYKADGVPVGDDQKQHLELMRTLAQRFNSTFRPVFTLPEAWIPRSGARIMALDNPTEKMSTSTPRPASKILLVDSPETITKKIKSAVTDSGRDIRAGEDKPAITNLLTIYSLVAGEPVSALEDRFRGAGYGAFKQALADAVVARLRPIQQRFEELTSTPSELERTLAGGAARARTVSRATMAEVRDAVGLAAQSHLPPEGPL